MHIDIRKAEKNDCAPMMELIKELALYEKTPEQVTVSFEHFVESGFGEKPVWWAFVATVTANDNKNPEGSGGREIAPEEQMSGADQLQLTHKDENINTETVVGFALYYIRYSTWKGQRLYLEDLLVTEDMRGRGIGHLLFDRLIEECKEKKYSGMMWQVLDWNEPAINFYKKYNASLDGEWINGSLNF
jgi:GNAT superfamily N-acetyltransferase